MTAAMEIKVRRGFCRKLHRSVGRVLGCSTDRGPVVKTAHLRHTCGIYCGPSYAFVFSEESSGETSVETNGVIPDLVEWHGFSWSWTFDATVAACRSVCSTR